MKPVDMRSRQWRLNYGIKDLEKVAVWFAEMFQYVFVGGEFQSSARIKYCH